MITNDFTYHVFIERKETVNYASFLIFVRVCVFLRTVNIMILYEMTRYSNNSISEDVLISI